MSHRYHICPQNFNIENEVTEDNLQVWLILAEKIYQEPSFTPFQQEHERLHGGNETKDVERLSTDDITENDNSTDTGNTITNIGVNDLGKVVILNEPNVENNNEDQHDDKDHDKCCKIKKILTWIKIAVLFAVWCIFTAFLMIKKEHVHEFKLITVPRSGDEKIFPIETSSLNRIGLSLNGPFYSQDAEIIMHSNAVPRSLPTLQVVVQRKYLNEFGEEIYVEDVSKIWRLDLVNPEALDSTKDSEKSNTYDIKPVQKEWLHRSNRTVLQFKFISSMAAEFPLQISIDESPIYKNAGVIYAAVVLCGLYVLIIWEIVNRTLAAIIASTLAIGILAALNARPSMATIISWIDVETLLLLFGMMILVAILSDTGVFDYLAVYAFKITRGKVWPLISCLCLFTAFVSSFLDNVTTVLLITPVTIRLCEVMTLNPIPILMFIVIYSNIGGAMTPVGDPPNAIIASNSYISNNGVNFAVFTLHMFPGVILVMIQTYIQLRFMFRNISDLRLKSSSDVGDVEHKINCWKRAASSLCAYTKGEESVRESMMKKVKRLKHSLKKRTKPSDEAVFNYEKTLEELRAKYSIRNKPLLYKCSVALIFVVSLFFLHSVPDLQRMSLGLTALLGAIFLIIIANIEDIEGILARVEWSTLLFFAALFVLMEALSELGLIEWIGNMVESVILSVSEKSRQAVAVLIILWVSALASAFVDNIPLTTMMVKVTISLAQNKTLNLPLQPLVWALAFGACLGGNGTLIGASANVVCAGVAEQHGYKFTFMQFFKVGFPAMIGSIIVITVYILIAHVVFSWH